MALNIPDGQPKANLDMTVNIKECQHISLVFSLMCFSENKMDLLTEEEKQCFPEKQAEMCSEYSQLTMSLKCQESW